MLLFLRSAAFSFASNPLVMCSVVSQEISKIVGDHPSLRPGLRHLLEEVDQFAEQVYVSHR